MEKDKNSLFQPDGYGLTNAYFGDPWGSEDHAMMEGYAKASLHLIDKAINDRGDLDYLIYPVLFLFRHFIELSIKEGYIKIKQYEQEEVDRAKVWGHFLVRKEFEYIHNWLENNWNGGFPNDVREIIQSLHDLDSKGDFFRYTHDMKGEKLRETRKSELIGYQELRVKVEKVYDAFRGLHYGLDEMIEQRDEHEAEMRRINEENRDYY